MKSVPSAGEIRNLCQPEDLDICLYRRFVVRRISIHFTRLFLLLGVSADSVSALKGIIACLGSLLFIPGIPIYAVSGAVLLQLSLILDASDGEVARYSGSCCSGRGEFIDKIGDTASRGLFYGAWGLALYSRTGVFFYLPAAMIITGTWLIVRFCAVETVLESISNHLQSPIGEEEKAAVRKLFVRKAASGRIEFILSQIFHPWVNLATIAAAVSFSTSAFTILFQVYFVLWCVNTIRKIHRGSGITSFRRPLQ